MPSKLATIQNRFAFSLPLISKIIHLQIFLWIIHIFFYNLQGGTILVHFFQLLVHLLADPSVIILCKSSSYPDDHQWFLQNAEACIIIFHILDDGFLMHSHSIHIPFCQKCIDQFPVSKTNQIAKFLEFSYLSASERYLPVWL